MTMPPSAPWSRDVSATLNSLIVLAQGARRELIALPDRAQQLRLGGRVVAQLGGRAVHGDAAVLQHIAVVGHLERGGGKLLRQVALFDVYRGKGVEKGKKSLAFRVLLQDTQKTLTESEIDQNMTKLIAALHECGAQLR